MTEGQAEMAAKSDLSRGAKEMLWWAIKNAKPLDHEEQPGEIFVPLYLFPADYGMDMAKSRWEAELRDAGYIVTPDELPARVTARGFEAGR